MTKATPTVADARCHREAISDRYFLKEIPMSKFTVKQIIAIRAKKAAKAQAELEASKAKTARSRRGFFVARARKAAAAQVAA